MYTTMCEKDRPWEAAASHWEPRLVLCVDLEGWVGGGKEAPAGDGDIHIYRADSCCCIAKNNKNF